MSRLNDVDRNGNYIVEVNMNNNRMNCLQLSVLCCLQS